MLELSVGGRGFAVTYFNWQILLAYNDENVEHRRRLEPYFLMVIYGPIVTLSIHVYSARRVETMLNPANIYSEVV